MHALDLMKKKKWHEELFFVSSSYRQEQKGGTSPYCQEQKRREHNLDKLAACRRADTRHTQKECKNEACQSRTESKDFRVLP